MIAERMGSPYVLTDAHRLEVINAARRLLVFTNWCRAYTGAMLALTKAK